MKLRSIGLSRAFTVMAVVVAVSAAVNAQTIFATASGSAAPVQPGQSNTVASSVLAAVDPLILGTCPAAVHDRYTVVGPDGQVYRTWHPQVVQIVANNPAAGICRFAHEHGDNPQTSLANPSLPAFGYIGAQAGDNEPHEGFKVFVINRGTLNSDAGTAQNSTRIVFHQGTAVPKRFDTKTHSMMFDLVAPDGHYVHVQGMADTGGVASICANPRQGRTVVTTAGCSITSMYEIWSVTLNAGGRATINASIGVFDPITVLNPNSLPGQRTVIYASAALPQFGSDQHGCDREAYAGPIDWYNQNGPTTFYTDAFGNLAATGLKQQVSAHNSLGVRMADIDFYQMKLRRSQCASGLGLKN